MLKGFVPLNVEDNSGDNSMVIDERRQVPQNAVTARISLYSFYRTGSEADSYFDNVSLTTDLERVELY